MCSFGRAKEGAGSHIPKRFLILSLFALLVACASPALNVKTIKVENAARDARDAVKRGDFRIIAVMGYARQYPSSSYSHASAACYSEQHGSRMIEGTSDAYHGEAEFIQLRAANEYARIHNDIVIEAAGPCTPA